MCEAAGGIAMKCVEIEVVLVLYENDSGRTFPEGRSHLAPKHFFSSYLCSCRNNRCVNVDA